MSGALLQAIIILAPRAPKLIRATYLEPCMALFSGNIALLGRD